MEGHNPWEGHGSGNSIGSRVNASADRQRLRLQVYLAEFERLLEKARNGSPRQHRNFWLVPVLHRLAELAEGMEASYCRQPGINTFETRRDFHPIGQAIRMATLGTTESDRYSPPDAFIAEDLFDLLKTGGGEGGGALVVAGVCRFLCSVAMSPADPGSRSAPSPPVASLLSDNLDLFDSLLSWVRGEVPPTGVFDAAVAAAAMERGREAIRKIRAEADPTGVGAAGETTATMTSTGRRSGGSGAAATATETVSSTTRRVMDAAAARAVAASAASELRVHATGLLSAAMFSRTLNDLVVHMEFAVDLVGRLREGPVADYLRAEAVRERGQQGANTPLPTAVTPSATVAVAVGQESQVADTRATRSSGDGGGAAVASGAREAPSESEWGWGRWPSMAAAEAEHVAGCVSSIGSYQEILAPLFGGDGLAVVDVLLAQPELQMRLLAVELVSTLLFHKKVGLAFVRRGWIKDLLRLGAMEDAAFMEPEVAFCLQNLATSGGVMEAVCRVQDGSLERLLEYAASLLRSSSEATQKNILTFWEAAMRYPPALEAFERHGALSKLLYLLLPTTSGYSDDNIGSGGSGAVASGGRSRSGSVGSSSRAGEYDYSPNRRRRRWQIGASSSGASASGGGGGSSGNVGTVYGLGVGYAGGRDHHQPSGPAHHRRAEVTLRVCVCLRQYLRCCLALVVLRQVQRAAGRAGGGGNRHHHQGSNNLHTGRSGGGGASSGGGGASGGGGEVSASTGGNSSAVEAPVIVAVEAASSSSPGANSSLRPTSRSPLHGRPVWWGSKPLAVDDASHAANVALVKGDGPGSAGEGRRQTAALAGGYGGWIVGVGTGVGGEPEAGGVGRGGGPPWGARRKGGKKGLVVRLGVHWGPAVQLIHHRGIQALLNVLDAMLSQRTMGADTAQHALDALGTAALCPLVYPEFCRPGHSTSAGDAQSYTSETPPLDRGEAGATATASVASAGPNASGRGGASGGSRSGGGGENSGNGWASPNNRLGVDVLLDAAGGVRQRDAGGVMCAALRVLETCCRPHRACGPLVQQQQQQQQQQPTASETVMDNTEGNAAAAAAAAARGGGGGGRRSGVAENGDNRIAVTVDDRLQRPMRKLIRERNGIRLLVGLLRYRRQAAVADTVRLRAALCLLGLAHDPQIAQVLEKIRITTTLSETVRSGAVGRNIEAYSQLREVAKQIISRVAGRLSSTVGKSGLMDPAVTGLERAAVVANTPITFRPRELLGIIHEYLAANGLSVAADALAGEAGLVVANPRRYQHPARATTPSRRVGGDSGGGAAPEDNTAGDGEALVTHVSPRSAGGYGRRRKLQDGGKGGIGNRGGGAGAGARADAEGKAEASGEPIRRFNTWDGGFSPRVGDKRNAKGGAKRVNSLSNSSGKMESGDGEGSQRKKRKGDSAAGKGKEKSRGIIGAPDGTSKMSGPADSFDGGSRGLENAEVKATAFDKDEADIAKTDNDMSTSMKSMATRNATPHRPSLPPPLTGRSKTAAAFASPSYFDAPRRLHPRKHNNASLSNLSNSFGSTGGNRDSNATATATPRRRQQDGHRVAGSGSRKDGKTPAHSRQSRGYSKGRVEVGTEASGGGAVAVAAVGSRRVTAAAVDTARDRGVEVVGEGAKSCNINRSKQRLSSNKKGATIGGTPLLRGFSTDMRDVCGGNGNGDASIYDVSTRPDPDTGAGKQQVNDSGAAKGGEMVFVGSRAGNAHGNAYGASTVESGEGISTTLDEIVTSFLRNQHERCPDPICVLPPLSLLEPHQCPGSTPAGAMGSSAPPNVAKRAALARQAVPPLGGLRGARLQRAFVHSRFRRHRSFQDPEYVITSSAFAMRPGEASRMWVGTDSGVVRLWSTFSIKMEGRWRVSEHPVMSIEQHPGDRFTRGASSSSPPLLLSSVGHSDDGEVLLWKALESVEEDPIDQEEQPLFRWRGLRAARFDHGGTRVAGVLYPHPSGPRAPSSGQAGHQQQQLVRQTWGAQVLDVETGNLLARLWDARSGPLYPQPNVAFNATDDLVVTDGALWDARRGARLHQYDKLGSGGGFGLFHPNGNEVIVDGGVWDLRTHRLLRTLPCQQDGAALMKSSPGGDVLYTYRPLPEVGTMNVPPRPTERDTCFGVLDASSYEQIHSYDTEKAIVQLTTDECGGDGSYISVIERMDPLLSSLDTFCSLYEVGRKRPDYADSDLDDAMSEESDEEWEDADHSDGGPDPDEDEEEDMLGGLYDWRLEESSAEESDSDDDDGDNDGDSPDLENLMQMGFDSSEDDDRAGRRSRGRRTVRRPRGNNIGARDRLQAEEELEEGHNDPGRIFRGGAPGVFGRRRAGLADFVSWQFGNDGDSNSTTGERSRREVVMGDQLRRNLRGRGGRTPLEEGEDDEEDEDDDDYDEEEDNEEDDEEEDNEEDDEGEDNEEDDEEEDNDEDDDDDDDD